MQKMICSIYFNEFTQKVNDYLSMGWVVIPGTLAVTDSRYAIVIEDKNVKVSAD